MPPDAYVFVALREIVDLQASGFTSMTAKLKEIRDREGITRRDNDEELEKKAAKKTETKALAEKKAKEAAARELAAKLAKELEEAKRSLRRRTRSPKSSRKSRSPVRREVLDGGRYSSNRSRSPKERLDGRRSSHERSVKASKEKFIEVRLSNKESSSTRRYAGRKSISPPRKSGFRPYGAPITPSLKMGPGPVGPGPRVIDGVAVYEFQTTVDDERPPDESFSSSGSWQDRRRSRSPPRPRREDSWRGLSRENDLREQLKSRDNYDDFDRNYNRSPPKRSVGHISPVFDAKIRRLDGGGKARQTDVWDSAFDRLGPRFRDNRNSTSPRRNLSPIRRVISPVRIVVSPSRRIESPVRRVISPVRRGISPVRRGISPFHRDISPVRRQISPVPAPGRYIPPSRDFDDRSFESRRTERVLIDEPKSYPAAYEQIRSKEPLFDLSRFNEPARDSREIMLKRQALSEEERKMRERLEELRRLRESFNLSPPTLSSSSFADPKTTSSMKPVSPPRGIFNKTTDQMRSSYPPAVNKSFNEPQSRGGFPGANPNQNFCQIYSIQQQLQQQAQHPNPMINQNYNQWPEQSSWNQPQFANQMRPNQPGNFGMFGGSGNNAGPRSTMPISGNQMPVGATQMNRGMSNMPFNTGANFMGQHNFNPNKRF